MLDIVLLVFYFLSILAATLALLIVVKILVFLLIRY